MFSIPRLLPNKSQPRRLPTPIIFKEDSIELPSKIVLPKFFFITFSALMVCRKIKHLLTNSCFPWLKTWITLVKKLFGVGRSTNEASELYRLKSKSFLYISQNLKSQNRVQQILSPCFSFDSLYLREKRIKLNLLREIRLY